MASIIIFSNLWGLFLKEWKLVDRRTRVCLWLGILALVVSVAPARAGAELNLFGWSEYVPQSVLDGFTKETGIKVNFETYASNEELLSTLVAGGGSYDLVQPSDYAAEVMIPPGVDRGSERRR